MGLIEELERNIATLERHGIVHIAEIVKAADVESVARVITSLESQLAQVTAERDEVRDEARERQRKLRILITYWRSICRAERRRLARIKEALDVVNSSLIGMRGDKAFATLPVSWRKTIDGMLAGIAALAEKGAP